MYLFFLSRCSHLIVTLNCLFKDDHTVNAMHINVCKTSVREKKHLLTQKCQEELTCFYQFGKMLINIPKYV